VLRAEPAARTVEGVGEGFQPAGRAAAPPPLDLVQDFVNTEIPEWARDDVATPGQLETWLRARGLLAREGLVTADEFVAARELRAALRGLALLNTTGEAAGDGLREHVASALAGCELGLELGADGTLVAIPAGSPGRRALAGIALVVVEAQAAGTWARLKACRKESCQWLFYDRSRSRTSSWCSMSVCGNRVKTAAYRSRRRASA
jgi:predicted RNA-binding Zn ribbon-like protein